MSEVLFKSVIQQDRYCFTYSLFSTSRMVTCSFCDAAGFKDRDSCLSHIKRNHLASVEIFRAKQVYTVTRATPVAHIACPACAAVGITFTCIPIPTMKAHIKTTHHQAKGKDFGVREQIFFPSLSPEPELDEGELPSPGLRSQPTSPPSLGDDLTGPPLSRAPSVGPASAELYEKRTLEYSPFQQSRPPSPNLASDESYKDHPLEYISPPPSPNPVSVENDKEVPMEGISRAPSPNSSSVESTEELLDYESLPASPASALVEPSLGSACQSLDLNGEVEDSPWLTRLNLRLNVMYKVLLCITCECAWTPAHVKGHLKRHGIVLSPDDIASIDRLVDEGRLLPTDDVSKPTEIGKAVEGLKVHPVKYCCSVKGCNFGAPGQSTFRIHYSTHSNAEKCGATALTAAKDGFVQTFFDPSPQRFFQVLAPPRPTMAHDPFSVYLEKVKPTLRKPDVISPAANDLHRPLHLRVTNWDKYLEKWTANRRILRPVMAMMDLPSRPKDAIDPFAEVMPLCVKYVTDTGVRIKNTPLDVRKALESWPIAHGSKAFRVHGKPETVTDYSRFLAQIVVAALRMLSENQTDYSWPLDPAEKDRGAALLKALEEPNKTSAALDALHAFIYPFFSAFDFTRPFDASDKFSQLIECAYALNALREDGTFLPPHLLTGYFAKTKYLCRIIVWFEADRHLGEFGNNPSKAIAHYVIKDLAPGTNSAFSVANDYAGYYASLVELTTTPPICKVESDGSRISYKESQIVVPDYVAGLNDMANDIERKIVDLFRGQDIDLQIPGDAVEDWNTTSRGQGYFSDISKLVTRSDQLMDIHLKDEDLKLMKVSSSGDPLWNMDAVHKVLKQTADITDLISVYALNTCGPHPRGTEFMEHKIVNSVRPRNIFVNNEKMYFVTRRVKNESEIGHESFIVELAHPRLRSMILKLIVGIRPMEQVLVRIAYSEEVGQRYDEYLYPPYCTEKDSSKFSNLLQSLLWKYCRIKNAGLRNMRQLTVELGRVYLGNDFVQKSFDVDDVLARQRGHSLAVERKMYAPEMNHLPAMSSDALQDYEAASMAWHHVLGCAPGLPPLVPCCLRKKLMYEAKRGIYPPVEPDINGSTPDQSVDMQAICGMFIETQSMLTRTLASFKTDTRNEIKQSIADAMVEFARHVPLPTPVTHHTHPPAAPTPSAFQSPPVMPLDPVNVDMDGKQLQIILDSVIKLTTVKGDIPEISEQLLSDHRNLQQTQITVDGPGYALDLLRCLLKDESAAFRSIQQRQIVEAALAATENFVGILPTGGGKSLAYLLPALKEAELGKLTMVIIPNQVLLRDQLAKAASFGLKVKHFKATDREIGDSNLIFVALETATSPVFGQFYADQQHRLVRVVIDEAHQVMTQSGFRTKFAKLCTLADYPIQKIYLTATLPVDKQETLLAMVGAHLKTRFIRAPVYQPRIRYMKVAIDSSLTPLDSFIVHVARMLSTEYLAPYQKGIIYVESIRMCDAIAKHFDDCCSHSDLTYALKMDNERKWMDSQSDGSQVDSYQWIVATTGMIHGVDHPNVGAVITGGSIFSIYNIFQGAGRGARGTKPSLAIVVTEHNKSYVDPIRGAEDLMCIKETNAFMATPAKTCLHHHLSLTFNGFPADCNDLNNLVDEAQPCFNCDPQHPILRRVLALSKLTESNQGTHPGSRPSHQVLPATAQGSDLASKTMTDDDYDDTFGNDSIMNIDPAALDECLRMFSDDTKPTSVASTPQTSTSVSSIHPVLPLLPPPSPPAHTSKRTIDQTQPTAAQPAHKRQRSYAAPPNALKQHIVVTLPRQLVQTINNCDKLQIERECQF
ncbi:hypothetical protein PTI98_010533 [Pleurotus ostreatus]|nr:hypothetical protein PTI98_010533 [Pleurotus ostreatus]